VKQRRVHVQKLITHHQTFPLKFALESFDLSKSSFFYQEKIRRSKRSCKPLDPILSQHLLALDKYELTLGYSKITDYLKMNFNCHFNKKKVYRHMKKLKLLQPQVIKQPKKKTKKGDIAFYSAIKSNVRWEADLTTIIYGSEHLYLFSVIDTFDKELIGHWLGFRCRSNEAINALTQAVYSRFPNGKVSPDLELVIRLDRGCQFTAHDFGEKARNFNLKMEFCDVMAPNQKPYIKSFFANFKREEVYRSEYDNALEVFNAWKTYVDWYNNRRPHSSLRNLSPVQFRLKAQNILSSFSTNLVQINRG
jgi:putative transposase